MNEFSPFAIPNHSSPISMSMQSLKKISQKLPKLESGNKTLMDRRILKQFRGYNMHDTLPLFMWWGIKIIVQGADLSSSLSTLFAIPRSGSTLFVISRSGSTLFAIPRSGSTLFAILRSTLFAIPMSGSTVCHS